MRDILAAAEPKLGNRAIFSLNRDQVHRDVCGEVFRQSMCGTGVTDGRAGTVLRTAQGGPFFVRKILNANLINTMICCAQYHPTSQRRAMVA